MKRMLFAPAVAVVAFLAWTGIRCAAPEESAAPPVALKPTEADARDLAAEKKLQAVVKEANFKNVPLGDCVEWLRKETGVDVHMKWAALETAGILSSTVVKEVQLRDVPAQAVLRAVLEDLGGTMPLGCVLDGGVLVISTKDDLSGVRYRKTVIYDIRDLLPPGESWPTSKGVRSPQVFCGTGGPTENAPAPTAREMAVDSLLRSIARVVDRDSWCDPYGTGTIGTMQEYGGLLIIQQTAENHRAIAALLADLRRHKPSFK